MMTDPKMRNVSLHMSTMHNPVPFFDMEAEIAKEKSKIERFIQIRE